MDEFLPLHGDAVDTKYPSLTQSNDNNKKRSSCEVASQISHQIDDIPSTPASQSQEYVMKLTNINVSNGHVKRLYMPAVAARNATT